MSLSLSIFAAAQECPNAIACLCGRESLTFSEMASRSAAAAHWLRREYGPLPANGSRVPLNCFGVVATNQLPTLVLIYAMLELGWPLALIHPRLPSNEIQSLKRRFGLLDVFEPGWEQALLDPLSASELSTEGPAPNVPAADAALCVMFTAGTTGESKAAVLSRGAIEQALAASAQNFGWTERDRWLLCLPLAHMGGLSIVLRCLAARKPVILAQPQAASESIDIQQVADALRTQHATLCSLVPTLLQRLLALPDFSAPPSLRAILLGGDGASPTLLTQASARGLPVFTSYGMTEMASQVTTQRFALGSGGDDGNGPTLASAELRIARDGRIEVRGRSLFSGYWQPPGLYLPLTPDGWFRTEDSGALNTAGCLHVLGRSADVLISGGENVYPAQVERAIQACPGVESCCVFGLPDVTWGEVVCALVVGPKTLRHTLGPLLREQLMPHQLPRRIALIESLPETAVGKLDRRAAALKYRDQLLPLEYR